PGDGLSVVVPWGEAFAITENTGAGVFLRPADLEGRLGASHELFRLADGGEIVDVRAAGTPEGVLVAARTDIGALRLVLARRDENGGLLALDGPRTLPLDAQVLAFDLAAHGDDWALALDLRPFDGSEPRREARLAFGDLRADLGPLGEAPPPLALASTGDDLVVTVPGGLAFAQAGLIVPPPAGATGDRLALASGEGEAIVGFDDGFGLALSRVTRDGVAEESAPGPAADAAGVVLERVGEELAVLGPGPDGRFVGWVLEGDLERYRVAGTPLGDGSGRAPSAVRAGNAFALLGPGVVAGTLQLVLTCE
ncbi:MAG TPA: hypothetical protein RMH80_21060, partial [Polyangiaceae bacterium LLY-WYZ-15_(1-7)]|nr:hypothetical protein [Polyangiaceae bacterium LLY-WYZ-15_(1-7)]